MSNIKTHTYDTTFEIRSPHGTAMGEIDIQATIVWSHVNCEYQIDNIFGFEIVKNSKGEYEVAELPYYLIEPVHEWLEGSEWSNIMLHIEEQQAVELTRVECR
ncbi:MAG: hypothetical protein GY938_04150 [Ketobacter sp.]|nr:hypothetical protein [Ketobacter sp.]